MSKFGNLIVAAVWASGLPVVAWAGTPQVVLPDQPTAIERSAAAELADGIKRLSGDEVAVVAESVRGTNTPAFFVGATRASRKVRGDSPWRTDGVYLKSVPEGLVLDGDPARGVFYAVDEYLERFCGVRWWTSQAAYYPHLDTLPTVGLAYDYAPPFAYRETYYLDGFDPKFKVRSKGNFTSLTRYLLAPMSFVPPALGGNHRLYFFKGRQSAYHSFFEILPPSKYFKDHPDWYSLVNGKRVPKQLCLANEEMKRAYIAETKRRLAEDATVDFIQVSQNDWNGACTCDRCRAMETEDGGASSGPYLRFANEVAAAIEPDFPHVRVDTFAYQFTRKAPTKTRPRSNVVVRLCDIECDFARPLDGGHAGTNDVNAAFVRDLESWRKVADGRLFIWDYLADFASYMMPHPNLYSIAPNIRLFAKNGAVGVFEQGDALCSCGSFVPLRHYVTSRLLWNPVADERKLIDEFLAGYYGKSAVPHLKKFLDLLDRGAKTKNMKIGCYHPGAPFWTVDEKLTAADLMDAAEAAAAKDGADFAARVRRERLSVDHYLLLNYDILHQAARAAKRAWRRPATHAQAVENWIRDVKAEGVRAVHETNDPAAQNRYFEQLRGPEAKRARTLARKTARLGEARVGFALAFKNNTRVAAEDMRTLHVVTNGTTVVATWKGHPACGDDFVVQAAFPCAANGGFSWGDFSYVGNTNGQHVTRIVFPEVYVPRGPDTALFVPKMAGAVLRPDWSRCTARQSLFKMGHFPSFRCMAALEDGKPGYYLDQRGEARRYATSLEIQNGPIADTLVLRSHYVPPFTDELSRAGALPFGGTCTPFVGGWWEATQLHRAWMKTQDWFQRAAKRDFSKFRDIDLWMWGRGGIEVSEPPVLWFMKETGLKVALDWYWWHNVPYDTCYPFFWPPRDGEAAFRASVARMKKAGAFVQVYTNGMLWDCDDARFQQGGLESAQFRADGKLYSVVYNPFTRQAQAHMCGEAPIFQEKMRALEKKLASTGLDGVYMDMISCAANGTCYNPRHRHAPGGGRAMTDGYRAYVQKVHEDNPGFLLSSEAPSEDYLDLFEAFIMLYSSWERNGLGTLPQVEPVPAVSVLYRGAAVLFGSFATPGGIPGWDPLWGPNPDKPEAEQQAAKCPDQFAVEFARGAVWGVQPMVHNFLMRDVANPRLKGEIEFMKTTAKFWHDHRDFLFDGEMLAPAKLACATQRTDFLNASSYKRPHQSWVITQPALPVVFHSGWRAKDGREVEILVNWSRTVQAYRLERNGRVFEGNLPARTWTVIPLGTQSR